MSAIIKGSVLEYGSMQLRDNADREPEYPEVIFKRTYATRSSLLLNDNYSQQVSIGG